MKLKIICINNSHPLLEYGRVYTIGKTDSSKIPEYWHYVEELPGVLLNGNWFRVAMDSEIKSENSLLEIKEIGFKSIHIELIRELRKKERLN